MARRVTSRVTGNSGSRTPQERERDYLAAIAAERDGWVKAVGAAGWQAELNRRRTERNARHRARRHQAALTLVLTALGGTVVGAETLDETEESQHE